MDKIYKPILNIFHLKLLLYLTILIFTLSNIYTSSHATSAKEDNDNNIDVKILPNSPSAGDTISVKISAKSGAPKLFFDKTKYPVFLLSDNWYRGLIPLSANAKAGKHELEIFYKDKVKRIDLIIKETKYPIEELTLAPSVAGLMATRTERAEVGRALSTFSEKKLWSGKFILPSNSRQSTVYGVKRKINGVLNHDYFHKGLDFAGAEGSKIIAPEDGKVILAGQESKGFVVNGNCIFLDHGHGVVSAYLHLSKLLVKEGDFVKKGQEIGKVGSTGIASGPHLHWGVYIAGKTVEPLNWVTMIIE